MTKSKPMYYECGICGCIHPWKFNGDCRDDSNRFASDQLDAKHGAFGWELTDMAARVSQDDQFKRVADLKPGDMVDLERDKFADQRGDHIQFQTEYATVVSVDHETPECTAVEFDGFDQVGFPPDHRLPFGGHDESYDS